MKGFAAGFVCGVAVLAFWCWVSTSRGIDAIGTSAQSVASEYGTDAVWLVEGSSIALASGSEPTVVFFGYPDNLRECERLAELLSGLGGMTNPFCEAVD